MVAAVQWLVVVSSAEEVVCVTPRPGPGASTLPLQHIKPDWRAEARAALYIRELLDRQPDENHKIVYIFYESTVL